jgi:hypothetical protein
LAFATEPNRTTDTTTSAATSRATHNPEGESFHTEWDDAEEALTRFFAGQLGLELTCEDNLPLYRYVREWYRTPYRYGGSARTGTDCSGFVCRMHNDLYQLNLPRSSRLMFDQMDKLPKEESLLVGDLVFFRIRGGTISHVGVYLRDGWFAHAAVRGGVIVSHLTEPYYARTYAGAARLH